MKVKLIGLESDIILYISGLDSIEGRAPGAFAVYGYRHTTMAMGCYDLPCLVWYDMHLLNVCLFEYYDLRALIGSTDP